MLKQNLFKMKNLIITFTLSFFLIGGCYAQKKKDKHPIVGQIESIKYTFKDSPVRFPKNYEITITEKEASIKIESYGDGKVNLITETKEITPTEWNEIVTIAARAQTNGDYPVPNGGVGYKSYTLIRKNAGTIESNTLSWTSLSEKKIKASTLKLIDKMKNMVSTYDEVLTNQKEESHPMVGAIEKFVLKSSVPYLDEAKNYEITLTPTEVTVSYANFNDKQMKPTISTVKITIDDWNEIVGLANNLQAAGDYPPADGATGFQSFTLIKLNGGVIEPYTLRWTGLSEDKIDENTKKIVNKILNLTPKYSETK